MSRSLVARAVLGALVVLCLIPAVAAAAVARPDLTVAQLRGAPASVASGGTFAVAVTVRNAGARRAGATRLAVYLSRDRRRGGDARLGAAPVTALGVRRTRVVRLALTVPALAPAGRYVVLACADDARQVAERREGDNCRAAATLLVTGAAGRPLTPRVPAPAPAPVAPAPAPTTTAPAPPAPTSPAPDPPNITLTGATAAEGDGQAQVRVEADAPAPTPTTLTFATADGTATAPADYTAATGTVTIPTGATNATITLPLADDTTHEGTETLQVAVGELAATVTVTDDDPAPLVSVADVTAAEADGHAELTVTLDAPSALPAAVTVTPTAGTATAPADFDASPIRVDLAAGETAKAARVPLVADGVAEPPEQFTVALSDATGARLGTATATVTLPNEIPARLQLTEVQPAATSGRLVELRVLSAGVTAGAEVRMGALTATLPALPVQAGDLIVLHYGPTTTATTETTTKGACADARCHAGAWDVRGPATNFAFDDLVARVVGSDGTTQDAVPFQRVGGASPAAFIAALRQIQAEGLWLPADCGGALCSDATYPSAAQVAADWSGVSGLDTSTSVYRVGGADTRTNADWVATSSTATTSTFGFPNP